MNDLSVTNVRKYQQSHPWIAFRVDLSHAPVDLWLALGECHSKIQHLSRVPLRPEIAQALQQVYLAKGVQATTAIEGNTLSEDEVRLHLQGRLNLPRSKQYLQQEVDNIVQEWERMIRSIERGDVPVVTADRIRELNRAVLDRLELDEEVDPGEFRTHSVVVGRVYRGAPAEDCPYLLDELCNWLNGDTFRPTEDRASFRFAFTLLKAIIAHIYIAWIHPFADGNGRTARLLEVQLLIADGVPAPAAHLLSNHFNATRADYYRQLDRASRSGGDVIPFIQYAVQGFLDGLQEQLTLVWEQQYDVAWRNYVHEQFQDDKGVASVRQRELLLALSETSEPVAVGTLTDLSPRVARAYASKTNRTLLRDLAQLEGKKLVVRNKAGYRANKEVILAFLPVQTKEVRLWPHSGEND